jgi:uncharacterized protein YkwD
MASFLLKQPAPHVTPLRRLSVISVLIGAILVFTRLTGYNGIAQAQISILGDPVQPVTQNGNRSTNLIGCGGDELPSSNTDYEARVVQLVNEIRLAHGLLPLKRVTALDHASRFHATDMAVDDYFSHNTYDRINGQLVNVCAWSSRIPVYYSNYNRIAENIAAGYNSPEAVVDAWMNSPGHRNNILNADNWEIGVGYYVGAGSYTHYWVKDLGRQRDVYPVVIDGDAATTSTGELTLHIYGDWQTVRFRDNDGPWTEWQPFQSALSRRIEGDAGPYTVHAELSKDNQTVTSSATIYLTQSNKPAELSALPDKLDFVYVRAQQRFTPDLHTLRPLAETVTGHQWTVNVDGNWLQVTPTQGDGAAQTEIRPSVASAGDIAPGTATVTFSLINEGGAVVDSHSMTVSLQVMDGPQMEIYLPTLQK